MKKEKEKELNQVPQKRPSEEMKHRSHMNAKKKNERGERKREREREGRKRE